MVEFRMFGENNPAKRPDVREKLRQGKLGKKNPMFGLFGEKHHGFGKKRPDQSARMKKNNPCRLEEVRTKISEKLTGRKNPEHSQRLKIRFLVKENHPSFGKKRPDMHAKMSGPNHPMKNPIQRERQSVAMKNGLAAYVSGCNKNPSKPQVKLFNMIKQLYPAAVLNHLHKNYSIDIVIPELNLAVEYDGAYWHQNKEADNKRQSEIEKDGWKFLRYAKLPNSLKLRKDILLMR